MPDMNENAEKQQEYFGIMTEKQKCENCKYYETQEKCPFCRNKYWYEPNNEIKIVELEEEKDYLITLLKDLLNNSDEYARQRAIDYLGKEESK